MTTDANSKGNKGIRHLAQEFACLPSFKSNRCATEKQPTTRQIATLGLNHATIRAIRRSGRAKHLSCGCNSARG
jgi:hypothetical protein